MGRHSRCLAYLQAFLISLLAHSNVVSALSWRGRTSEQSMREQDSILEPVNSASQLLRARSQYPTSYEIALNELEELESEPLCHRIAARLLVNNCQLLEGKDEATVLTDSGRKIRDFVDSYAASLAICDLERGRFTIPPECTKLQEPTLSQLPIQKVANLHITSTEIDECLSGLGTSDSAWNTWVSYRHKALRFCEAARADNDKAQNIILFQRLTKIMSKLTDDVDAKIQERMDDLDVRTQEAGAKVNRLSPLLEKLHRDLEDADNMLSNQLLQGIKKSQDQVNYGLESAAHLERMLQIILKAAVDSHAQAAVIHGQSLELMNQQTTSEMEIMISTFAAAVAATGALQSQIESSRVQAAELESRQDNLERGMLRLIDMSDTLVSKYDVHSDLLQQAHNITNEILDTLEETSASASSFGDAFSGQRSMASWWPYIWCPVVSLVMGSYGLPPSLMRNLALVALGETTGFIISSFPSLFFNTIHKPTTNIFRSFIRPLQTTDVNQTASNLTSQR